MRLGHGQRRSVLILWLWTALLSGLVLYPTYTGEGDAFVPLGVGALALVLFTVLHPDARARDDADVERVRAPGG
jgi:UDP-GlcNAc:undecaprenyl-phosphate/decaprenyl-phosphate GlcNAc-1-phosphate transferase